MPGFRWQAFAARHTRPLPQSAPSISRAALALPNRYNRTPASWTKMPISPCNKLMVVHAQESWGFQSLGYSPERTGWYRNGYKPASDLPPFASQLAMSQPRVDDSWL